jgi:hypothetical protein
MHRREKELGRRTGKDQRKSREKTPSALPIVKPYIFLLDSDQKFLFGYYYLLDFRLLIKRGVYGISAAEYKREKLPCI